MTAHDKGAQPQHTPTPWRLTTADLPEGFICVRDTERGFEEVVFDTEGNFGVRDIDAAFIVTACNAHAALLAQREEISAALYKYAEHQYDCDKWETVGDQLWFHSGTACTCGLDKALALARGAGK